MSFAVVLLVLESTPAVPTDWTSVGLVACIVGAFLLGNAILFRRPEIEVQELLGRSGELASVREQLFQRAQIAVGFFELVLGFGLQIAGRLHPPPPDAETLSAVWIGAVVLLTAIALSLSWVWSARRLRRAVRAELVTHGRDLESDVRLARELGLLFGVESQPDDTIATYAERLRVKIGLPPRARRAPPFAREAAFDSESAELP